MICLPLLIVVYVNTSNEKYKTERSYFILFSVNKGVVFPRCVLNLYVHFLQVESQLRFLRKL